MKLNNENISLRAVEPQDLELLYRWENNPEVWDVGNTRQPYSRYMLKQYIVQQTENDIYESKQLRMMIEEKVTSAVVGTVDLFDLDIHNSRIALGLYVHGEFRGKGYATQALHLIEDYTFEFLKLNQLYCHISVNNHSSRSIFEKEGYETNGVLKRWIKTASGFEDIIVFQRFMAGPK